MRIAGLLLAVIFAGQIQAKKIGGGFKLKKGQMYTYQIQHTQNPLMTMGEESSSQTFVEQYTLHLEVKEKTKDTYVLVSKLKKYGRRTSKFPSNQVIATEWDHMKMDSLVNKYMLNRSYFIRMDRFGNVINITEPNFQYGEFMMDTLQLSALDEFVGKANFKVLLQPALFHYPRNDVQQGDVWSNVYTIDAGVPVEIDEKINIRAFTKEGIMLGANSTVKIDPKWFSSQARGTVNMATQGMGGGDVFIDPSSLMLLQKKVSHQLNSNIKVDNKEVKVTNSIQITVELTDR